MSEFEQAYTNEMIENEQEIPLEVAMSLELRVLDRLFAAIQARGAQQFIHC